MKGNILYYQFGNCASLQQYNDKRFQIFAVVMLNHKVFCYKPYVTYTFLQPIAVHL